MAKNSFPKVIYTNDINMDESYVYNSLDEVVDACDLINGDEVAVYELKYVKKLKLQSELV